MFACDSSHPLKQTTGGTKTLRFARWSEIKGRLGQFVFIEIAALLVYDVNISSRWFSATVCDGLLSSRRQDEHPDNKWGNF